MAATPFPGRCFLFCSEQEAEGIARHSVSEVGPIFPGGMDWVKIKVILLCMGLPAFSTTTFDNKADTKRANPDEITSLPVLRTGDTRREM